MHAGVSRISRHWRHLVPNAPDPFENHAAAAYRGPGDRRRDLPTGTPAHLPQLAAHRIGGCLFSKI
jgi:hypothetical protein